MTKWISASPALGRTTMGSVGLSLSLAKGVVVPADPHSDRAPWRSRGLLTKRTVLLRM